MKKMSIVAALLVAGLAVNGCQKYQKTETQVGPAKVTITHNEDEVKEVKVEMKPEAKADAKPPVDNAKSDQQILDKAAGWVKGLDLNDADKENRVATIIARHMKSVRDWHNEHPYTTVPAGINPLNGLPLSNLDREVIADSAMPKKVHEDLMTGLKNNLTPEQAEAILDKYTVGKVAFTMKGYRAIVPDLTDKEAEVIEGYLKEARERAVDFKSMKAISAIFEIYKTKSEQYLNSNGRNWKQLFTSYVSAQKAMKAQKAAAKPKPADSNSPAK
jgi:hypothetical protein